ncbi:MAG: RDD family protein [Marmoricola sp.]
MTEESVSPIPREARPYQGHPAGLVSRSLANLVDGLLVVVVLVAGYVALNAVRFVADPQTFAFIDPSLGWIVLWALWVTVIYFTAAWAITGRTYGCHLMGLRVVGRRGGRVRPLVALARAVLCVMFPIGLLWCVVSPQERSLQDVLLRTSVVYDWVSHARERSPGG